MKEAEDERYSAKSAYETAAAAVKSYQAEVDAANADLLTKLNARQAALNAYTAAGGTVDENDDPVTSATSEAASTAADLSALADALVKANGEYKSAEQTLKTAEANLQTAQSASNYTSLSSAYNQAQTAYEQAKTTYENAIKTSETAEESRDELEELQSQLEKCTLKAETSGKVTAVNATVGSAIDGAAATIQDTDSLKISITIAEYDIGSVSEGMHAVITSDVIDGEINGTLTQISPTASGGGSSSSTFSAEVTVDDENSGLLIGTNAKVQIIQSTTEDVFTVPLDAIEEKEDGTSVIYVQSGEENGEPVFEEVQVVVGATNDYYAEVSGVDLEEGMIVRASASLEEATEEVTTPSDMMMGGGEVVIAAPADGGGAMPSGGGGGNMGGGRPGMGG